MAPSQEDIKFFFTPISRPSGGNVHEIPVNKDLRKVGDVYYRSGRMEEALQCYLRALDSEDLDEVSTAIVHVSLGRWYLNRGHLRKDDDLSETAIDYFNRALRVEGLPDDLRDEAGNSIIEYINSHFLIVANRLYEAQNYSGAASNYEMSLVFDVWTPDQRRKILDRLVATYLNTGEQNKLESVYLQLLDIPGYKYIGRVHANLATVYYNEGSYQAAMHHAQRAIECSDSSKGVLREAYQITGLLQSTDRVAHFFKSLELSETYEERVETLRILCQFVYGAKDVKTDEEVKDKINSLCVVDNLTNLGVFSSTELQLLRRNIDIIEKELAKRKGNQTSRLGHSTQSSSSKKEKVKQDKKPTKEDKGKERMPSTEDKAFQEHLKSARAQAALTGDKVEEAEVGVARLVDLMRGFGLKQDQKNQAREDWLLACKNLCSHYVAVKQYDRIVRLFEGREKFLEGKSKVARWCRTMLETAREKTDGAGQQPKKKGKGKEAVQATLPPQQQKPGNPMRERRNRSNSISSEGSSGGSSSSTRGSVSETTRTLIRQDSARLILESNRAEEFDAQEALALMVKKYGEGARQPALQALIRARIMFERAISRKSRKPSKADHERREYAVDMARPDLESEVPEEHRDKFSQIMKELKSDPRKGVGKPK